jgi:F0F1-type ATP synthase delta subunit
MNTITRSAGMTTGLGYLVGSGYEGKTKEFDNTVTKIAKLLQRIFKHDVEIRFNTDRESGGAFIKDDNFSWHIGIGASLFNSTFLSKTSQELRKMPDYEFAKLMKLPKDAIRFHAVLDESLSTCSREKILRSHFDTMKDAFRFLLENMSKAAVKEYFEKIQEGLKNG